MKTKCVSKHVYPKVFLVLSYGMFSLLSEQFLVTTITNS
jgi:hypothetical protein